MLSNTINRDQIDSGNPANRDESGGSGESDPLFARRVPLDESGARGAVLEHEAVEAVVRRTADRLGLGIPATTHVSEAALFDAVPEIGEQARREGAEGEVNAVYYKGQVHVVASKFADAADVETAILEALAHEGQGHYGIRAMYGDDAKAVRAALVQLYRDAGGEAGVRALAEKRGVDMRLYFETAKSLPPEAKAAYLADELLAHLQGKQATESLPAQVLTRLREYAGAVREWLRAHGFENLARGTDADIALLLSRMRAASQTMPTGRFEKARFSRQGKAGYASDDSPIGVEIDARTLRDVFEHDQGEPLAWSAAKAQAVRDGSGVKSPFGIEVGFHERTGKLQFTDGRHRTAVAAERGERVTVYTDRAGAEKLAAMGGVVVEELDGGTRFARSPTDKSDNFVRGQNQISSVAEPVASGEALKKADWKALRDGVLKKLREVYEKPKKVEASNGDSIIVAFGGLKHALHNGVPSPQETALALHIDEAIRLAEKESVQPDKAGRKDPFATTTYTVPVKFDGVPHKATIFVRNHTDGNRYYDHAVVEKESPAGLPESAGPEKSGLSEPTPPFAGLEISLAEIGVVGTDEAPLFARRPSGPQRFTLDPETQAERVQRIHQDKMNRWTKVQRQIAEQGGTVGLDQDVYHAMERMTGRAGSGRIGKPHHLHRELRVQLDQLLIQPQQLRLAHRRRDGCRALRRDRL